MKALVLRKYPFSEADLIVHFLLEDGSRASGFGASARRSKRRFPHQFDSLGVYEVEFSTNSQNNLRRIRSCELLDYSFVLSNHVESLSRWATLLEWLSFEEAGDFYFEELLELRRSLADCERGPSAYFSFFLKELQIHGVFPHVSDCARCHGSLVGSPFVFNFDEGGVLHDVCSREGISLTFETLSFLQNFSLKTHTLKPIHYSDLDRLIVPFLEKHLGRQLKSHRFLRDVLMTKELSPLSV